MALFNKKPKTSAQKAQKAQLGILARLIGCAYLIYIVIQLLRTAPEDDTISPTLKIIISIFFLCAAAIVIIVTILEFIRNWRGGFYKAVSYTDDVLESYASHEAKEFPLETSAVVDENSSGFSEDDNTFDDLFDFIDEHDCEDDSRPK